MSHKNKLVTAKFIASAGQAEALFNVINACKHPSRNEEGNVYYDIYRNSEDSNIFLIHEEWKGEAAIDFEQPHFKQLVNNTKPFLQSDPEIQLVNLP